MNLLPTGDLHADIREALQTREGSYPLAVAALRALLERQPGYATLATAALRQEEQIWANSEARCGEILHLCAGCHDRFRQSVREWMRFSVEYLRRQQKFLKTGRYAQNGFAEVRQELYDNSERMTGFYLMALMFSFVFSTNYAGFFEFFRREMLPRVRTARAVSDVGCGHGVYLAQMLLTERQAFGTGIDISPGSLETTARLLEYHRIPRDSYRLTLGDLQGELPLDQASQDAVTCFEVIEHLEDPGQAVRQLRRVLKPGGVLCLSTAVRMESIDHLHLFRSPAEVRTLTATAGFTTTAEECIPLTSEDVRDPAVRARLVEDPDTAVGYVALLA